MRMRPDTLADGGCWISDDRVYALVSNRGHGLAEIGYHGLQPVSRNSRIFVHEYSALECSVISPDGQKTRIPFEDLDWQPDAVRLSPQVDQHKLEIEIRACERRLTISLGAARGETPPVAVRCPRESLFTGVQGERHWEVHSDAGGVLRLSFRDRIVFNSWIRQSGPYSGDFLIPEPWRRLLFRRSLRSGEATLEDVRAEYRDAPVTLYDATTWVYLGGEGFSFSVDDEAFTFTTPARAPTDGPAVFEVSFEDDPPPPRGPAPRSLQEPRRASASERPRLDLMGYPRLSALFEHLPDIVDSCVVRDFGVPRANPGRYYWIWAWDLMVTAVEMLRWGDHQGVRRAARFVSTHRDLDGRIPGRWTRALEPLDTPVEGAGLEFLLAHLCYELYLESGSLQDLLNVYPVLVSRFRQLHQAAGADGLLRGKGFYPDLPGKYGRSEHTATAIESGSWYGLSRILQNMALLLGDPVVARETEEAARSTRASFLPAFWDPLRGTLHDAVDQRSGRATGGHPIFSYLCLQSPLTLPLVREKLPDVARFVRTELMTDYGLRTVPLEERGDGAEVILDAWYPHWDLYALRLLRKAGEGEALLRWLTLAETALGRLGYCPEFLALEGFRTGDPSAWTRHGAPSNLNCASAWYHALLEIPLGLETDAGGLTVSATAPAGDRVSLRGLHYRQGRWDVDLLARGPSLVRCLVDGTDLRGCRKIPRSFCGPGRHRLEIHYGPPSPGIVIEELLNAEVLQIGRSAPAHLSLRLRLLGPGELRFHSLELVSVCLDGTVLSTRWDAATGSGWGSLDEPGEHDLDLAVAKHSG